MTIAAEEAPLKDSGSSSESSALPLEDLQDAVIRFAGNSQDGIQTVGGFLARLAGRSAREVMTYMTIPSTISGGPSIFQVHLGRERFSPQGTTQISSWPFTSTATRIISTPCETVASAFTTPISLSLISPTNASSMLGFLSQARQSKRLAVRPSLEGRTCSCLD